MMDGREEMSGHPRLTEKVYEMLREDILSRKLVEGQRLTLNVIAKDKNVSITPVREALVRLEKEGFVKNVRRGGSFVREISRKEIKDTYEVREALEVLGIQLAAKHITDQQLKELKDNCAQYEHSIKKREINRCIDNDINFHYLLAKASGNEKILTVMHEILFRIALMISRGDDYWYLAEASLKDHYAIYEALARHDTSEIVPIISAHVRRSKENLFELE